MAVVTEDAIREVRRRLYDDFAFYSPNILKIPVQGMGAVPLELRPVQLRLWLALKAQRESGRPMRVVVLKARKVGISTSVQGMIVQRVTQRSNHNALIVAQDNKTAGTISQMAEFMYAHLPDGEGWEGTGIKPPIANRRRNQEMVFGNPAREARERGHLGLNSRLVVDNAKELEAGRGETFHSLHLSEVSFWSDIRKKLTNLRNTVPQDDLDTLIALEATANGHNEFKEEWDRAERGESEYLAFFSPWFEDERYRRPFAGKTERDRFRDSVGSGPWGQDEPQLLESIPAWFDLHQNRQVSELELLQMLNWRRWAIENLCGGKLDDFHQEYPAFPSEAFLSTGRQVFSSGYIREAITRAAVTDPKAEALVLFTSRRVTKQVRHGTVEVPVAVEVRPKLPNSRDPYWKVWERPKDGGQYVIACDPASGEGMTGDDLANFAIQVVDHRTRVQVAEWAGILDPDLVAEQLALAQLWYSRDRRRPWVVVEKTGGYGSPILTTLYHEWGLRQIYTRRSVDRTNPDSHDDRLGWDTNRATKQFLHDEMTQLLREWAKRPDHFIRSLDCAKELETYVRKPSGRTGPSEGNRSDRLMALMMAEQVAHEKRPFKEREPGRVISTSTRAVANPVTGY